MSKDPNLITELILKYARYENLTEEESRILEAWQAESEANRRLPDLYRDKEWVAEQLRQMPTIPSADINDLVSQRTGMKQDSPAAPRRSLSPAGLAAVAILLLGMGVGYFYWRESRLDEQVIPKMAQAGKPGHYESVLTQEGGIRQVLDSTGHAEPFEMKLPDGSKARLAYGSSLRYALAFNGKTQEVFLRGQADFEVAQKNNQAFIVHAGSTEVQVSGTAHFNVMAYADEAVSEITLLNGKVLVQHDGDTLLLKPADQAIISGRRMSVRVLGHPNGTIGWGEQDPYFEFDNVGLNTVVRRLARWYRIKVIYNPDHVTGASITGIFLLRDPLDVNLAHLGDAEATSAKVQRKGDTIFLLPDAR